MKNEFPSLSENPLTIENFKKEYLSRALPEEYKKIIKTSPFIEANDRYSENLYHYEKLLQDPFFIEKVKDSIVLDLGCGDSGLLESFTESANAKLYIGIDKNINQNAGLRVINETSEQVLSAFKRFGGFNKSHDLNNFEDDDNDENTEIIKKEETIKINSEKSILLKSDMLTAIAQFPNKSVSTIFLSGIEFLNSNNNAIKYHNALVNEIERIIKKDGIVIIYHSDVDLPKETFSKIKEFVYQKINKK